MSTPRWTRGKEKGALHSISLRQSSFSLAIVLVGPLAAPVFLSHIGGTSLSSAAFWLKVVVLGSFPSLSGARAGNSPASLPRTVGAAMAASSAQKDPTDELQEEELPGFFDDGGDSDHGPPESGCAESAEDLFEPQGAADDLHVISFDGPSVSGRGVNGKFMYSYTYVRPPWPEVHRPWPVFPV